jgi:hypothetical protein
MASVPITPPNGRVWTRTFLLRFGALVLVGVLVDVLVILLIRQSAGLFGLAHQPVDLFHHPFLSRLDLISPELINGLARSLALALLIALCLKGARFAPSRLARGGLYLQASSAAMTILQLLPYPLIWLIWPDQTNQAANSEVLRQVFLFLPLVSVLLSTLSLLCLSYGLVRWRLRVDSWLAALYVLLSVIGSIIVWNLNRVPLTEPVLVTLASTVCVFFALALLLLRPRFWWRFPLVVLLLAPSWAWLAYLVLTPDALAPGWAFLGLTEFLKSYSLVTGREVGFDLLVLLGFLVLVQGMRVQRAQGRPPPLAEA